MKVEELTFSKLRPEPGEVIVAHVPEGTDPATVQSMADRLRELFGQTNLCVVLVGDATLESVKVTETERKRILKAHEREVEKHQGKDLGA